MHWSQQILCQADALAEKNLRLFWKRKTTLFGLLIVPFLFTCAFWALRSSVRAASFTPDAPDPPELQLRIQRCSITNHKRESILWAPACTTVMFAPANPATTAVMTSFAASTGLTFGTDVVGKASIDEILTYLHSHPGQVGAAVSFTSAMTLASGGGTLTSTQVAYQLWFNSSSTEANRELVGGLANQAYQPTALKAAVDGAIVAVASASPTPSDIRVTIAPFPRNDTDFSPVSSTSVSPATSTSDFIAGQVTRLVACLFLLLGALMFALFFSHTVLAEKRQGHLAHMRMMGLCESAYWITWLAPMLLLALPAAALATAAGVASGSWVWARASAVTHVLLLWLLICACCCLCLFLTSFLRRPRWVNLASLALLLTMLLFQNLLAAQQMTTDFRPSSSAPASAATYAKPNQWDAMYSPAVNPALRFLLFLQPWFHYGRAFQTILDTTATVGTVNATAVFTWANTSMAQGPYMVEKTQQLWHAPSVGFSMGMLVLDCIFYLVLAWYVAQISSPSTGGNRGCFFPCSARYWSTGVRAMDPESLHSGDTVAREQQLSHREQSVRAHKLTKAFDNNTAVKEMSVTMNTGQVFCLLGQNGAGKSTIINTLIGRYAPTHGEAFVQGYSVREELGQIQQRMGVCPQDDVLYSALSGRAHLRFWARFKGLARSEVGEAVTQGLASVGLLEDGSLSAGSYSGGMKRRLSVAIATTGQSKVIFLDEPTTGMDPLSRRRVWDTIAALKTQRVVVLTTHSMEEADALGDQIAIMSQGRLRAIGDSMFLKARYGNGYQLKLLCADPEQGEEVLAYAQQSLPGAEVVSSAAGAISLGLPPHTLPHLPPFLRWLEQGGEEGPVREWGVANSTLEEVFLRLAAQNNEVNAALGITDTPQSAATAAAASPSAAAAAAGKPSLCAVCGQRSPVPSTVFSGRGIAVCALDLLCAECAAFDPLRAATDVAAAVAAAAQGKGAAVAAEGALEAASTGQEGQEGGGDLESKGMEALPPPRLRPRTPVATADDETGTQQQPQPQPQPAPSATQRGRRATLLRQARALYLKSAVLQAQQRKTNCCISCVVIVSVALLVVLGLLFAAAGSRPSFRPGFPASTLCPAGYFAPVRTVHKAGSGGSTAASSAAELCSLSAFLAYMKRPLAILNHTSGSSSGYSPSYPRHLDAVSAAGTSLPAVQWAPLRARGTSAFRDSALAPWAPPAVSLWVHSTAAAAAAAAAAGLTITAPSPPSVVSSTARTSPLRPLVKQRLASLSPPPLHRSYRSGTYRPYTPSAAQQQLSQLCNERPYLPFRLYSNMTAVNASSALHTLLPDAGITLSRVRPASASLHYSLHLFAPLSFRGSGAAYAQIFYSTLTSSGSGSGSGSVPPREYRSCQQRPVQALSSPTLASQTAQHALSNALLRAATGDSSAHIYTSVVRFQRLSYPGSGGGGLPQATPTSLLVACLLPLLSMIFFGSAVSTIVAEKQQRLWLMLRLQGTCRAAYWLGTVGWWFTAAFAVMTLFFAAAFLAGVTEIAAASPLTILVVFGMWAYAQTGFAVLMAGALSASTVSARLANTVTIVLAATAPITHLFIAQPWPWALQLLPPCAFLNAMSLTLHRSPLSAPPLAVATTMLFLGGSLCLLLGVYLHAVLPTGKDSVQTDGPLFFLPDGFARPLLSLLCPPRRSSRGTGGAAAEEEGEEVEMCLMGAASGQLDEDVAAEALRLRQQQQQQQQRQQGSGGDGDGSGGGDTISMHGLRKEYGRGGAGLRIGGGSSGGGSVKVAVAGVSLGVTSGECFGLLGPNGAGKTTLINMLSGTTAATSGSATIAGYDLTTQLGDIHSVLGVCPQFDTVWPDLTTRDHLRLFCRLKGVTEADLQGTVQALAEQVDLDGDPLGTAASELSGGMRRRLSLGISLAGAPKVLFLDEPTTGLDPETRQSIWGIVNRIKPGCCTVLTTHSMEEADALCTRIGIMAYGQLQCLGSQLRLKNRFGDGYHLRLRLSEAGPAAEAAAEAFIHAALSRSARAVYRFGSHMTFNLPAGGVRLPAVFEAMQRRPASAAIQEWSVNQSSLEEVFVKIVEQAEHNQHARLRSTGAAAVAAATAHVAGTNAAESKA